MAKKTIFLFVLFLTTCGTTLAGDIAINGFVQGNYSFNLNRSNPDGKEYKWAEERIQLKLNADKGPLAFFIKGDISYDHIDDKSGTELREVYLDYVSEKWDLRIGRQVITWGVGDLIFLNDVFPKDYEAFYSGRPLEYLKKGADGVKIGIYPAVASVELVIIPVFEPNVYPVYPHNSRMWVYDVKPQILWPRNFIEPSDTFKNTEFALRIYRTISEFDVSLYYYRGFYKNPYWLPDEIPGPSKMDYYYPDLSVYGASLQGQVFNGILSLEGAFYDSRNDRDGSDPVIPNQSSRFLIGYQKQLWRDFTASLQYYSEYKNDYNMYTDNHETRAPSCPVQEKIQSLASVRLSQLLMHQTLKLSFFGFWSPTYEEYMLIPEIKYTFSDHVWAAIGANIFGGGKRYLRQRSVWTKLGMLDDNDNIYLQFRHEF